MSPSSRSWERRCLGLVLPALIVVLALLPIILFQDRLPERVATHWDLSGRPQGSMTLPFLVVFQLAFAGVPAWLMRVVARRRPAYRGTLARSFGSVAFFAALSATVSWTIVAANLDVSDWSAADTAGFAIGGTGLALATAAIVGVIAGLLARTLEGDAPPVSSVPSADLPPGARAVWLGSARSRWAWPLFLIMVPAGAYLLIETGDVPGLILVLAGCVALPFTSLRVLADRSGITLSYGPFGWPQRRIPLADVERARRITVRPLERGGWGYRGSLRFFGRAAVVLRGGEGLELDLVGNRLLVITVDDAERGAGLINDLLAAPATA